MRAGPGLPGRSHPTRLGGDGGPHHLGGGASNRARPGGTTSFGWRDRQALWFDASAMERRCRGRPDPALQTKGKGGVNLPSGRATKPAPAASSKGGVNLPSGRATKPALAAPPLGAATAARRSATLLLGEAPKPRAQADAPLGAREPRLGRGDELPREPRTNAGRAPPTLGSEATERSFLARRQQVMKATAHPLGDAPAPSCRAPSGVQQRARPRCVGTLGS
jgi:hypothetical protein